VVIGCTGCKNDTILANTPPQPTPKALDWATATQGAVAAYRTSQDPGEVQVLSFEPTVSMSSYLLALTIGPLEYSEASFGANKVPI